jgi:hypothetical protein
MGDFASAKNCFATVKEKLRPFFAIFFASDCRQCWIQCNNMECSAGIETPLEFQEQQEQRIRLLNSLLLHVRGKWR